VIEKFPLRLVMDGNVGLLGAKEYALSILEMAPSGAI